MKNKSTNILTIIASVILWIVILLAALFSFTTLATKDASHVSNVAGYTPLSVSTNSMAPTFNAGDLIIIKTTDPETLEVGDIVTFHTIIENRLALNTHRIDEIRMNGSARSYVTKGDNNAIADTHIIADGDIVGKHVATIPMLGKVMNFLSSSIGFLIVIVLPMLLFFIYQVYHLIVVSINLKKAIAIEAAEEAARAAAKITGEAPKAESDKAESASVKEAAPAEAPKAEPVKTAEPAKSAEPAKTAEPAKASASDMDELDRLKAELAELKRKKAEAEEKISK